MIWEEKTKRIKTQIAALVAGLVALFAAVPTLAEYPQRPVTIIVPWGAGGGNDTIIRVFSVGFEDAMGQPDNMVNRTGGAPALQDLVAGDICMFTGSPIEARALADAGEVKNLGIMSDERSPAFPDVPTLKECGVDWSLTNWFSLCAPTGLPDDVKAKVEAAVNNAHGSSEVQDALAQRCITLIFDGSESFSSYATSFAGEAKSLLTDLDLAK